MARKFLTNVDLAQNQILNAVIQGLSSAPSSPVAGQAYFDTTLHEFGVYSGSGWVYLGSGGGTVTSVSVVSANGFAGTVANSTTTPAITLTTSITGILKGNGTAISAAVSGTDYAPATSGTSALKGNGSGGFSNATLNDVGAATASYSLNSQNLTNVANPVNAQDAATKNYVDTTAQGLSAKNAVQAATAAALPANTYANGTSGVGATLTANSAAVLTVDGYTVALGDRILVQNEATASHNGIYSVTTLGTGSVDYVLTRTSDFDIGTQMPAAYVFVENGTVNADSGFVCTTTGTITIGTTSINFTQFSGAGEITAGTGLTKSGNTLSLTNPVTVSLGGTGVATITGLVKGNGTSAFTAAVSGTDYAPATSGSTVLGGNGSGGFSAYGYATSIGNGSNTSFTVTHNLGSNDTIVQLYDTSTGVQYEADVTHATTNTLTIAFATAPTSNQIRVVVIRAA